MSLMPDIMAKIPLIKTLSTATQAQIARAALIRQYGPGESILVEGQAAEAVFFIVEGEVRVYHLSMEGREQVLATLGNGASFNTVAPLLGGPSGQPGGQHSASARTTCPTTLLVLHNESFITLLHDCPDFSFAMLREFAGRLAHLTRLVENLALHSVRGRMARFLLNQAEGATLTRRWTQDEMAEQIATVRDVVGRTLREFSDAGYIRREGHKIILLNRAGLENEANL